MRSKATTKMHTSLNFALLLFCFTPIICCGCYWNLCLYICLLNTYMCGGWSAFCFKDKTKSFLTQACWLSWTAARLLLTCNYTWWWICRRTDVEVKSLNPKNCFGSNVMGLRQLLGIYVCISDGVGGISLCKCVYIHFVFEGESSVSECGNA